MKRRLSFLLCLLVVSWALSLTVLAAAPALQDEAGLLQDPQGLEALLTQAGADYDTVVAACLVPSCDGQDPDLAAEEAYDRVYGPNTPGILLFIAQSERVYRINVTQGSREAFNDKALAHLRSVVEKRLRQDDYDGAVRDFAATASEMLRLAASGSPYGSKLSPLWILGALGLGSLGSALPLGRLKQQVKSVRKKTEAKDYIVPDSLRLLREEDTFVRKTTERVPIPAKTETVRTDGSHTTTGGSF